MDKPSKNLTWNELACKDGTAYPQGFIDDGTLDELVKMFENVRKFLGDKRIYILSAYRTRSWNKKIKGALNSQHCLGRALDIAHDTLNPIDVFTKLRFNVTSLGIRGLGNYPTFTHIDCRKSDKLAVFSGFGAKDDNQSLRT